MQVVGAGKYRHYVVDTPEVITDYKYHGKPDQPFEIYMSDELVPGAKVYIDIGRRTKIPRPNPTCEIHSHPSPQVLLFVGEAGSFEVEVPLNDEVYVLDRTAAVWIPAGVKHNLKYRRIDGPMWECGVLMQPKYE